MPKQNAINIRYMIKCFIDIFLAMLSFTIGITEKHIVAYINKYTGIKNLVSIAVGIENIDGIAITK